MSRRRLILISITFVLLTSTTAAGIASAHSANTVSSTGTICDVIPASAATPAPSPDVPAAAVAPDQVDLILIDLLSSQLETSIAVAEIGRELTTQPELAELAGTIIADQSGLIAQLQFWRATWYPDATEQSTDQLLAAAQAVAATMIDPPQMPPASLLNPASALVALCHTDTPFDIAVIDAMTAQLQATIAIANVGLENSTHAELRSMLEATIDMNQREIAKMQEWRSEWSA